MFPTDFDVHYGNYTHIVSEVKCCLLTSLFQNSIISLTLGMPVLQQHLLPSALAYRRQTALSPLSGIFLIALMKEVSSGPSQGTQSTGEVSGITKEVHSNAYLFEGFDLLLNTLPRHLYLISCRPSLVPNFKEPFQQLI